MLDLRALRLSCRNSEKVHGTTKDQYQRGEEAAREALREAGSRKNIVEYAQKMLDEPGMLVMDYDDWWGRGYVGILKSLGMPQTAPNRGLSQPEVQLVGNKARKRLRARQAGLKAIVHPGHGADRGVGFANRIKKSISVPIGPPGRARRVPPRRVDWDDSMPYGISHKSGNQFATRGER